MQYKNHQKVAAMLKQQNERIAIKCVQLSQDRDNELRQAKTEKDFLKDLKKQHPLCRCWFKKHLRQTVNDIKVKINFHMQRSKNLLNERNVLECSCFYI